jgi:hypothetical protein
MSASIRGGAASVGSIDAPRNVADAWLTWTMYKAAHRVDNRLIDLLSWKEL